MYVFHKCLILEIKWIYKVYTPTLLVCLPSDTVDVGSKKMLYPGGFIGAQRESASRKSLPQRQLLISYVVLNVVRPSLFSHYKL